jgi:hypothetical protein
MQRQNLQSTAKTKFTTSWKDKIYNQLERQNLQSAAKTKHPTSCKTNLQPAARQNLHGAKTNIRQAANLHYNQMQRQKLQSDAKTKLTT